MIGRTPIRRALLSVSDKRGVVELARALAEQGVVLVSTGGTARALREAGLIVQDVAEVTGFPEIMQGRVKTLHPAIHGALLGRTGADDEAMRRHSIDAIDLLVVNLYPFEDTIGSADSNFDDAIENIDIGGPAMLRAGAKNHARVAVVVSAQNYADVIAAAAAGGSTLSQRQAWAAEAFAHTADYDGRIAEWLGAQPAQDDAQARGPDRIWPRTLHASLRLSTPLRYGENPHQHAALYLERDAPASGVVSTAAMLQGRELSYNNLADADAALECVKHFRSPACVIVKHANPCGVALGQDPLAAYVSAHATDPTSAFGGIIAFNRELDAASAKAILDRQFVEVVVAPAFARGALKAFARKPNVRVLACGDFGPDPACFDVRRIAGAMLVQSPDRNALGRADCRTVTRRPPSDSELDDLLFAWHVAMHVKSNAIVYAHAQRTIGIGAGQSSRVVSARIAAMKAAEAGLAVAGSVMASDAFFPFRDGLDAAAAAGIRAVIQPGGSMRDAEVIAAADAHDIAMVFTGVRHFRH